MSKDFGLEVSDFGVLRLIQNLHHYPSKRTRPPNVKRFYSLRGDA